MKSLTQALQLQVQIKKVNVIVEPRRTLEEVVAQLAIQDPRAD